MTDRTQEPVYGLAPGAEYDATLLLLMPDEDETEKRPVVRKEREVREC